jgi:UDP-N-acetylglucosamine 3-dehydrogenase
VTVLIVGLGHMGANHVRVATRLGLDVVGVDPDRKRRRMMRQEHAIDTFVSLAAAFDHGTYDRAVIATPMSLLAPAAHVVYDRGVPELLVEKPGGLAADQVRCLPPRTKVGYVERYNPAVNALKADLNGQQVRSIIAYRLGLPARHPVDVTRDLATHDIDVVRYLAGRPRMVESFAGEGECSLVMALPNGGKACISASYWCDTKLRRLKVQTDQHTYELDYQTQVLTRDREPVHVDRAEPLMREWQAWLAGGGVDRRHAAQALELVEESTVFPEAVAA